MIGDRGARIPAMMMTTPQVAIAAAARMRTIVSMIRSVRNGSVRTSRESGSGKTGKLRAPGRRRTSYAASYQRVALGAPSEVRLRKRLRRTRIALAVLRGCATRSPQGRSVVPLAGIEPALLAELDFESSASTSSATGALGRRFEPPSRSRRNIAGSSLRSTRAYVMARRLDRATPAG